MCAVQSLTRLSQLPNLRHFAAPAACMQAPQPARSRASGSPAWRWQPQVHCGVGAAEFSFASPKASCSVSRARSSRPQRRASHSLRVATRAAATAADTAADSVDLQKRRYCLHRTIRELRTAQCRASGSAAAVVLCAGVSMEPAVMWSEIPYSKSIQLLHPCCPRRLP